MDHDPVLSDLGRHLVQMAKEDAEEARLEARTNELIDAARSGADRRWLEHEIRGVPADAVLGRGVNEALAEDPSGGWADGLITTLARIVHCQQRLIAAWARHQAKEDLARDADL